MHKSLPGRPRYPQCRRAVDAFWHCCERWPHRFEHESGDDKWNSAGLTAVQGCPRRRAGVACDERTTDAVGISCSPRIVPPDQAAFGIAGSDAKYALSGVLPPWA